MIIRENLQVFNRHQESVQQNISQWSSVGLCFKKGSDDFYNPEDTILKSTAARYCVTCPVQQHCLYTAIITQESHGLWGGLTPRQRRVFVKRIKNIAKSKNLELSFWNKDVQNFIFNICLLDEAYSVI
jgi:WhiB family redox-sensing transcriptional regulator